LGTKWQKKSKAAFEMDIIYHNRHRNEEAEKNLGAQYVSFDELIEQSDVLSIHANFKPAERAFNASVFR
jgi:lactate dehydrogenase-like 2-hydroxyacid dehydrogenase